MAHCNIAGATLLSQEARRHFYSEARLSRGLIYISPLLVKGAEVVCGFYVLWLGHDFPSVTTSLATHFSSACNIDVLGGSFHPSVTSNRFRNFLI